MTKLLYIQASPRGAASGSIAVADAYLAALKAKTPDLEVDVLDPWTANLPEFDGNRAAAKQYIDVIHQPGLLFGLDPATGYFGLLKDKQATVVYTSGAFAQSMPSPAYGIDHQSSYMTAWLNQAGVTDITEIRYQPTILTADGEGDFERAKAAAAAAA